MTSHCHLPAKHECYVSQGTVDSIETLFGRGGKRLQYIMANLIRNICPELYQNRPHFIKDMTKTFWYVCWFTVPIAIHLQNVNFKFHMVHCSVKTLFR